MTVSSFVPEIWSDVLAQSLKQETGLLEALAAMLPDIQVDEMIVVCGYPWWLSWEEVLEPKPWSIVYVR